MMQRLQRFSGAMLAPVMLFSFFGIVIGFSLLMSNPTIMGDIAAPGTVWSKFWSVVSAGAWTPFTQLPILFVIGLPINLAKKNQARAVMEALVVYIVFNYYVNSLLTLWPSTFGVSISETISDSSKLSNIAGITTLDTGMIGALIISGIVIYLHNRYFETKLPEVLSIFSGSSLVVALGFVLMLPIALLTCFIWPKVQDGMLSMQSFFIHSGGIGVFVYEFLQKALLPTGLHHFVYAPFTYGDAVVKGGLSAYWVSHISDFQTSAQSLKNLFPEGGFTLSGMSKVFGTAGLSLAMIRTAKPEKRKKTIAVIAPAALTAILTGITEPIEFTFLFAAPSLWIVHSFLDALLAMTSYYFGIVGDFGGGLINWLGLDWLPLWNFHRNTYLTQIIIGLVATVLWYYIFTFMIKKLNLKTPGREDGNELIELYQKPLKKELNASIHESTDSEIVFLAKQYLELVGGKDNVMDVTNCATRLRITVKDASRVADLESFKSVGAAGLINNGRGALQIIVGLNVPQVRDAFETEIEA